MSRRLVAAMLVLVPAALGGAAQGGQDASLRYRIVDSASATTMDLDALAARVADADVALIGEQHDSGMSHRVQRAMLEAVADRRGDVTLALEMFERDVQETIDHFQMGHMSADELWANTRPWPQYEQYYAPLVDLAVARQWTLVAPNVPRTLAAEVARGGLGVLADRPAAERAWFAADLACDMSGPYYDRFVAALGTHGETLVATDRASYYQSQCLKDETMAESIAQVLAGGGAAGGRPLVIGVQGAVHVDYRLGTVERVIRRRPQAAVLTITMIPVERLDAIAPDAATLARADVVVWVSDRP